MPERKIETAGFRPSSDEQELLLAAEAATGHKRSELLRRCLKASIALVVREILSSHDQAVSRFETIAQGITPLHESPTTYRAKPPPKRKAG